MPIDKKTLKLLNQSKGSIEKVGTMLEKDQHSFSIIQQISAAQGLLEKAKKQILKNHLDNSLDGVKLKKRGSEREIYRLFNIKN